MTHRKRIVLFLFFGCFLTSLGWARSKEERRQPVLDKYRDYLKDRAIDYRDVDASHVEEELTRLKLYKKYPHDQYFIQRSVKYYVEGSSVEGGELDLVVVHRSSKKVRRIVEVKRLRHGEHGANYGRKQLDRFLEVLKSADKINFWTSEVTDFQLEKGHFDSKFSTTVGGIQQKGCEFFDDVIDITKGELSELKQWLKDYQIDRWERLGKLRHQGNYRSFVKSLVNTTGIPDRLKVYRGCKTAFAEGL